MNEKQLISKIKELRAIKPRQDWVFLTKNRILGQEENIAIKDLFIGLRFVLGHKYAFSSLIALIVLIGTFGFAQNSLPGDSLYSVKKITEKSQTMFISEQSKRSLELVNKRLDDLTKIAQANSVKNLAPAIDEYKETVSEAAKQLAGSDLDKIKGIALEIRKLGENKQKVEALGVVINGTDELNDALAQLVEREINDLETRVLTEEQKEVLSQMKEDYENNDYFQALERILILSK